MGLHLRLKQPTRERSTPCQSQLKMAVPVREFGERLSSAIDFYFENREDVDIPILTTLNGNMLKRIHNKGLDSDNIRIGLKGKYKGKYSPKWAKTRKASGRQTEYVDLEFFSDLRNAFQVGVQNQQFVLGFSLNDTLSVKKQEGHESRYNTKIWAPTTEERQTAQKVAKLLAVKLFKKAITSSFR